MKNVIFCINFEWKNVIFGSILNEKCGFIYRIFETFFCKICIFLQIFDQFSKNTNISWSKKMTIFCEFFGFFWIFWIFCDFCEFFGPKILYTNRFFWAKSDKIVIFLIFVWFFLILPYIMVSKMWHFFVKFVFFHFFGDFRGLKCDFWFIF